MVTWSPGSSAETARDWARSGVLPLTGHSTGPPILPAGAAASWADRMADRVELATRGSRHPVRIDGPRLLSERAALIGGSRRGQLSVGGSCRLLPTLDGWAAVSSARPDDPLLWSALIGHDLDERLPQRLAAWLAVHSGAQLDERATLLSLAAGSIRTPGRQGDGTGSTGRCTEPPQPGRPRSVERLLVVDFSALWAGPLCAHLLGLAGADVVKVEVPSRPDGARQGNRTFYDLLHGSHSSVALDPADPAGRTALHALVRRADIVIEASRPRALAGFGLDALAEVERGCTWVSITARGRASDRVGFGDDVAAACGLLACDEQGLPVFCGDAIADPLTGLTAAALALSEPEGGGGVLWDVAMADVVAATLEGVETGPGARMRRAGTGWAVDTGQERVPVLSPVARTPRAAAPDLGADTGAVLRRLGIAAP
ncbi:CoA transferase [Streptomyces sp. NPDC048504]|uniref:CoA transferase n=1 Tax=Streptomyces sp. NPDC048504 TaxID=3365559 RepID=UPI0037231ED9